MFFRFLTISSNLNKSFSSFLGIYILACLYSQFYKFSRLLLHFMFYCLLRVFLILIFSCFLGNKSVQELPISTWKFFENIREFGGEKYFTDHSTGNKTQLFVAIKGNFTELFFFKTSFNKVESPSDYLINVATYVFAYH